MIDERGLDRIASSGARVAARPVHCRRDLIHALTSLLEGLQARGNCLPCDASRPGQVFEHWEDESYCYLEIKLAGRAVSGIDVNVSDGRAFIRLER